MSRRSGRCGAREMNEAGIVAGAVRLGLVGLGQRGLALALLALVGCRGSSTVLPPPDPRSEGPSPLASSPPASAPSATATAMGGDDDGPAADAPGPGNEWRVTVTSNDPSLNPAMFEGTRSKVFFDHTAAVRGARVVVTHPELPSREANAALAKTMVALIRETSWSKLAEAAEAEPSSEGGTTFVITVVAPDGTEVRIETDNPADHPPLPRLLDGLQKILGAPGGG
ncbi:MAG: hypothetical protein AAGN82_11770 [Myxococcota bacterium]